MKSGFSTEVSLNCPLLKHQRYHDITANMTYFNLWIKVTTFPEMSIRTKAILIHNIVENFLEGNWGDRNCVFKDFTDFLVTVIIFISVYFTKQQHSILLIHIHFNKLQCNFQISLSHRAFLSQLFHSYQLMHSF